MKLIYLVNIRIPTERAHGIQISKMCEAFARQGVEVELTVPERKNKIQKDFFEFYNVEKIFKFNKLKTFDFFGYEKYFNGLTFYLQGISFFIRLFFIKFDKKTIIYTRNPEIVWQFSLRGFKTVYDAHNWPESKTWLLKLFLKKVYKIVCNSHGTEEEFRKNGFSSTLVAPNGVDLSKFIIKEEKEELRQKLGLPLNKKIALYIGHLYGWKGVDNIIEAAYLMEKENNLNFVLIGGTDEEIAYYKKLIIKKRLENILLYGYKPVGLMPEYLKCADILLLPNSAQKKESVFYTSPIKMFEYMASGQPIIASNLPSIKEILDDTNAILFEADNANNLVEKIILVLNDANLGARIAEKACSDVKGYTWEKRAEKIIKEIKKND